MQSSDLTEPYAREVNAAPPSHRSSSSHSSHSSRPRISPLASQNHAGAPAPGQLAPSVNEVTPIVSNGVSQRSYNSTAGLRNRDTETRNSQLKRQPTAPDSVHPDAPSDPAEPRHSWYHRVADRYGSLELENKGSVARDHLALERTFLAWLRTSLAFASIGIAVTQLFRLNTSQGSTSAQASAPLHAGLSPLLSPQLHDPSSFRVASKSEQLRSIGKPLGTTFIGVAIVILMVGFHRYFESQYWIIRGKFPASRGSVALIAFIAAALIIAALVVILAISPGAVET
ncbi:hypothetical protein BDW42DRAFT_187598 [Aspergillus taichungensis]|uniref:DUF202 domain-containing protein n=1 Tax=Aspergillus taichungensis TaxID=482145 RepID=A0A2J5HLZ8_9EURO|nr:hypothetical protein BDW42DRAFT_187598 [Aspergillus taichungensis]